MTLETTTSTAKPLPGAARVITESANHSKQTLVVGESLRIVLQTAGGSGYSWQVTQRADPAVVDVGPTTQAPTTPRPTSADGTPVVGAPESASTLVEGVAPGTTSIELSHIGPTGGKPDGTFTIDVVVEKSG